MKQPQIRYAQTSDGVSVAYWVAGEGAPLVYMPPLPNHIELAWQRPDNVALYEWLSERYRVVRIEPRNHGLSQRGVADVSYEACVRDIEAVADRLQLDRFTLLGHGTAGPVSIVAAAVHPERIERLMLVNATVFFRDIPPTATGALLRPLFEQDWETFTEVLAGVSYGWRGEQREEFAEIFRQSITWEDMRRAFAARAELTDRLLHITAPTLVVHQRGAGASTIEVGQRIAAEIPDASLVTLEGKAPAMSMNDPRMFAAIEEFMGETTPDQSAADVQSPMPSQASGTAVILFTDIVSSTALTERMGDTAFRDASRSLDAGLRGAIRDAGGAAVEGKLLGDGVLATFPSAAQAIDGARRCLALSAASELGLHIGLHAGDVIHEGGNVYGGAVNIASRVCGLSAPGEILVSGTVRELARTSTGVVFEDRGEFELKGIGDAVRVYEVRGA